MLHIAVTFKGRTGTGPTKVPARLSSRSIPAFEPQPGEMETGIEALRQRGFILSGRGRMTVSVRGTVDQFEKTFGTRLTAFLLDPDEGYASDCVYYPAEGAPWDPDPELAALIDDAYIQWPHIYLGRKKDSERKEAELREIATAGPSAAPAMQAKSLGNGKRSPRIAPAPRDDAKKDESPAKKPRVKAKPPKVDYYHLDVLRDVPDKLNVPAIHQQGHAGEGIRIAMIDTGFDHSHPFFKKNGFTSTVVLAPGATNRQTDPYSHGTGESANVFGIAPKVTFIGVKLMDDDNQYGGASILEGLQEALKHKPHVITVSLAYDLRTLDGRRELPQLPNGLKPLEAEIQAAIAEGTVIVFAAGNGHYAFPASMPEVIAAGGAYIDEDGDLSASDYASAFASRIYSGRHVPDVCGLVGMLPNADYIMLPVPPGSQIDVGNAEHDRTTTSDGWAVFSGTSAAAPQVAAVCALLLEKNPQLTPGDVKALLMRTAVDVLTGHANPASDPNRQGLKAGPGRDSATGAGLADAGAAWTQA
jgi:subtilisin family serine protease